MFCTRWWSLSFKTSCTKNKICGKTNVFEYFIQIHPRDCEIVTSPRFSSPCYSLYTPPRFSS
jgi:hypothetical protein